MRRETLVAWAEKLEKPSFKDAVFTCDAAAELIHEVIALHARLDSVEREARFCSRCGHDKKTDAEGKATP